jgi:hypothetical protein
VSSVGLSPCSACIYRIKRLITGMIKRIDIETSYQEAAEAIGMPETVGMLDSEALKRALNGLIRLIVEQHIYWSEAGGVVLEDGSEIASAPISEDSVLRDFVYAGRRRTNFNIVKVLSSRLRDPSEADAGGYTASFEADADDDLHAALQEIPLKSLPW